MKFEDLSLKGKIEIFQDFIARKNKIEAFLNSSEYYSMELKAKYNEIVLWGEDEKLAQYIKAYYKKELANINEKLNELLK